MTSCGHTYQYEWIFQTRSSFDFFIFLQHSRFLHKTVTSASPFVKFRINSKRWELLRKLVSLLWFFTSESILCKWQERNVGLDLFCTSEILRLMEILHVKIENIVPVTCYLQTGLETGTVIYFSGFICIVLQYTCRNFSNFCLICTMVVYGERYFEVSTKDQYIWHKNILHNYILYERQLSYVEFFQYI